MRSFEQRLATIAVLGLFALAAAVGCKVGNDVVAKVRNDSSIAADASRDAGDARDAGKPGDAGARPMDGGGVQDASLQHCVMAWNEVNLLYQAQTDPDCSLARLPSFLRDLVIASLNDPSVPPPVVNHPEVRYDHCDMLFHPSYRIAYATTDSGEPDRLCPYYCDYVKMKVTEDNKILQQCATSYSAPTPGSP